MIKGNYTRIRFHLYRSQGHIRVPCVGGENAMMVYREEDDLLYTGDPEFYTQWMTTLRTFYTILFPL